MAIQMKRLGRWCGLLCTAGLIIALSFTAHAAQSEAFAGLLGITVPVTRGAQGVQTIEGFRVWAVGVGSGSAQEGQVFQAQDTPAASGDAFRYFIPISFPDAVQEYEIHVVSKPPESLQGLRREAEKTVRWTFYPISIEESVTLTFAKALNRATIAADNPQNIPLSWSSSDPNIATVDANGQLTGTGIGSCTVTAAIPGTTFFDSCTVRVNPLSEEQIRTGSSGSPHIWGEDLGGYEWYAMDRDGAGVYTLLCTGNLSTAQLWDNRATEDDSRSVGKNDWSGSLIQGYLVGHPLNQTLRNDARVLSAADCLKPVARYYYGSNLSPSAGYLSSEKLFLPAVSQLCGATNSSGLGNPLMPDLTARSWDGLVDGRGGPQWDWFSAHNQKSALAAVFGGSNCSWTSSPQPQSSRSVVFVRTDGDLHANYGGWYSYNVRPAIKLKP